MSMRLGVYEYAGAVVASDPGAGNLTVDDPITTFALSTLNTSGNDVAEEMASVVPGDVLLLQTTLDGTTWATFTVTDVPIDGGTWWAFPVETIDTEGVPPRIGGAVRIAVFAAGETVIVEVPGFGMGSDLAHPPPGRPPNGSDLAKWLSINAVDSATRTLLEGCCDFSLQYELGRLSTARMQAQGFDPPHVLPGPVAQAVLMRAASMFRRRNSVNGFEGFADLGAVAIRASDPDIERLVDPWRAWAFA